MQRKYKKKSKYFSLWCSRLGNFYDRWEDSDIPLSDKGYPYKEVIEKIRHSSSAFGVAHKSCRAVFGTKIKTHQGKFESTINGQCTSEIQKQ